MLTSFIAAYSPNLNPLDFYLWCHLKQLVYTADIPDEGMQHIPVLSGPRDNNPKYEYRENMHAMKLAHVSKCVYGLFLFFSLFWSKESAPKIC